VGKGASPPSLEKGARDGDYPSTPKVRRLQDGDAYGAFTRRRCGLDDRAHRSLRAARRSL